MEIFSAIKIGLCLVNHGAHWICYVKIRLVAQEVRDLSWTAFMKKHDCFYYKTYLRTPLKIFRHIFIYLNCLQFNFMFFQKVQQKNKTCKNAFFESFNGIEFRKNFTIDILLKKLWAGIYDIKMRLLLDAILRLSDLDCSK